MPLQIRRGTDAERLAMTQPLAQGELLFVSTPGAERLYIGNGSTLGGIQITGYTNVELIVHFENFVAVCCHRLSLRR